MFPSEKLYILTNEIDIKNSFRLNQSIMEKRLLQLYLLKKVVENTKNFINHIKITISCRQM